ncbi:MAG TPA: UvrD-helicase domain-containing protein [Clostridium sp.]|uniref:UvrD-helicase domain-containing protein n=1 Tax=Clostridium sp. TaxID=1506 RepID=UPI002F9247F8
MRHIKISDQSIRDESLETQGNIVISASAGTGKTHTIIERILRDNEKINTYKTYAAITFTRKASKEIKNRMGIGIRNGFIGTNDNFILQEVIQPFIRDAYGEEYNKRLTPDFSNERASNSYSELLNIVKSNEEGFVCKYKNPKKNFGFELALNILKESHVAKRYLKSKYFRIYVDEYQDCDQDMHKFFLYLSKILEIPLFLVGDIKQSIYEWRGGYPEGFKNLINNETRFSHFELKHNFRSNKQIQNYSNIFIDEVRSYYTHCDNIDEVKYIEPGIDDNEEILDFIKLWCDNNKTIAFLVRKNVDGESFANYFKENNIEMTYIPRSPLDDQSLESNHIWISRCLAFYLLQKNYSEHSFYDEIPMPETYKIKDLKIRLERIKSIWIDNNLQEFQKQCIDLYIYLADSIVEEKCKKEIQVLINTLSDSKYIVTYNQHLYKHILTTIHSSKGLQYDQVIILAGDYFYGNKFEEQLHYVAVSRAKEKLLILLNNDLYLEKISECITKVNELGFDLKSDDLLIKAL